MPVSSFSKLRNKIRSAIRDTYGLLWDDTALDKIINEAQREYSILAGSLIGTVDAIAEYEGVCACPADYIEPVKFIGVDNTEKPIFSWRYLDDLYPDFRSMTGTELKGIVTDFDGFGKYRMFPKLPPGTEAGKFYYKRLAAEDVIETMNDDAIEQHCLFQVFLLTGKSATADYYDRFISAVNGESANLRGLKTNSRIRRGRFF